MLLFALGLLRSALALGVRCSAEITHDLPRLCLLEAAGTQRVLSGPHNGLAGLKDRHHGGVCLEVRQGPLTQPGSWVAPVESLERRDQLSPILRAFSAFSTIRSTGSNC